MGDHGIGGRQLPARRASRRGRIAAVGVLLTSLVTACAARPSAPPTAITRITAADLVAMLDRTAAGGPIGFRITMRSDAVPSGLYGTAEGILDLATSRGRSLRVRLPGTPLELRTELELDGSDLFLRANGTWDLRYGGAGAFLELNFAQPGDARSAFDSTLPDQGWAVDPGADPFATAGSRFRVDVPAHEGEPDDVGVVVSIDPATGRLLGLLEHRSSGETVIDITGFGVPFVFDDPPPVPRASRRGRRQHVVRSGTTADHPAPTRN